MDTHIETPAYPVRNNSIDIFRYVCSIMVVIIHSTFYNDWGSFGYFVGNVFTRIAVPFFFAVSGYFYVKKLVAGKKVFFVQIRNLLSVYAVWSGIYLAFDFLNQVILDKQSAIVFVKDSIINFCIYGTREHFWFFPAIIIATCLLTLLYKLKMIKIVIPLSIVLYVIGCLGSSYYGLGIKIPYASYLFDAEAFNTIRRILFMGFPFFSVGYLLFRIEKWANKHRNILSITWIFAVLLFFAEIILLNYYGIANSIVITFGLYILLVITVVLLLNYPLERFSKVSPIFRTMANFTYYSHPLIQQGFAIVEKRINNSIPNLLVFILTIMLTATLGLGCYFIMTKSKNKVCYKIVKLIVG